MSEEKNETEGGRAMTREWKVGDEVACCEYPSRHWSIHKIIGITPSGLLKLSGGPLLYPSLRRQGGDSWNTPVYREVTDEIRAMVLRQRLVRRLKNAAWESLPTSTLEAVHETLTRCKAEADAAAK